MSDETEIPKGDANALAHPDSFNTEARTPGPAPLPEPVPTVPLALPKEDPQTNFTVYDKVTGRVRFCGHCPTSMVVLQEQLEGEHLILDWLDGRTHYVDVANATGLERPTFPAFSKAIIKADGADAAVLALPVAAVVTIDGVAYDVPAEELHFTADSPGPYEITVSAWPYQDLATTITGEAA